MPMYPTPAELESQKRRLRHKAAPVVSHEPIIVEESWAKANMVPIIGAVVGLTSLALVGTTLAVLNKKKHFIGGHHEEEETTTSTTTSEGEEGWGTKLKSGAKKAAIGAGVSKVMHKWGHHEEESTTTTSESENEGFGQKVAGVGKKAALAAGVHQFMKPKSQKRGLSSRLTGMLHSSSELENEGFMGRVMHAPFVGKMKNKMPFIGHHQYEEESTTTTSESENEGLGQKAWRGAKKAGFAAGVGHMMHPSSSTGRRGLSSKLSGLAAAPFIGKMKNKMPFIGHHQYEEESTTTTSESENEGMNLSGKAKKAAGLAAAGYGLKKAINRNASESTTSTSASEGEEGFGRKMKGAALGMGLSRAMQKPKQKKVIKKRVIRRKVAPAYY